MNVEQEINEIKGRFNELHVNDHLPAIRLEKFKGRMDGRDFNEFLKEFYKMGNMYSWSEKRCCLILPAFLENDAMAAYESLDEAMRKNWKTLVDELAKKLARSEDLALQRRKLIDSRQSANESAMEFAIKIKELVKRAYPASKNYTDEQRESIAIDYFTNGLKPELQDETIRKKPATLSEAIEIARAEEVILARKKNSQFDNGLGEIKNEIKRMNDKIIEINAVNAISNNQNPNQQNRGFRSWIPFGQNNRGRGWNWPRGRFWPRRNFGQNRQFNQNFGQNVPQNYQNYNQYNNQNNQNFGQNGPQNFQNYGQRNDQQNNNNSQNNFNPNYNNRRGRGGNRGRGRGNRGRGSYSINEVTANFMPLTTILCLISLFSLGLAMDYQVCPQPRSGYLLSWPTLQNCESNIDENEELKSIEMEIFVPRIAPKFIPGFKCVKEITQYFTKRIFKINIDDWSQNITESISEEECWKMAKEGKTLNGTILKKLNEDLWQSETEEISEPYSWFGTDCINSTIYKLEVGTVGSVDGKGMVSRLEEMSRCLPFDGHCEVDNQMIIWPMPNETTFCIYESAGKFKAIMSNEYILVEEIQAAFISANKEIPEEAQKCVPENAKLMENEVIISILNENNRKKRTVGYTLYFNTPSTSIRTPPRASTTFAWQTWPTTPTSTKTPTTQTSTKRSTTHTSTKRPTTQTGTRMLSTQTSTVRTTTRTTTKWSTTANTYFHTPTTIKTQNTAATTTQKSLINKNYEIVISPMEEIKKEQFFNEFFFPTEKIETTVKNENVYNTPEPPIMAQEFRQENNNLNVKSQYLSIKTQNETKELFNRLWNQICRLHNFQTNIVRTILKIDAKEGVRLWLNRNDLTAVHNGQAILVAVCTPVKPKKIFWSNMIGNKCYEYTPVRIENMTMFILPGSNELTLHSPNISCEEKAVPAFQDNKGEWRTEYGVAQVSSANQHLVQMSKQNLIKFRAASIFNSDLHRIATSVSILDAYAKRVNQKVINIPRRTHYTGNNDDSSFFDDIADFAQNAGEFVVNKTEQAVEKIKEQSGIFSWLEWLDPAKWSGILKVFCIIAIIIMAIGGIIYTFPYWLPFAKLLWPKRKNEPKAITVAAINKNDRLRRSEESVHMLNYFPKIYAVKGSSDKSKRAYIDLKVNGKKIKSMIDPGAEISYCRESVARNLNLFINKGDTPMASAANQTAIPFLGSATVKIKFGDIEMTRSLLISKNQFCPAPILIGTDLYDDIRINFKDSFVTIDGITLPLIANINLKKEYKIYVDEKLKLPPHSDNFIMARTKYRFPIEKNFLVTLLTHSYALLLIGKSIVCPGSTQQVPLRLMNTGNKEITIFANSNIAKLEEIDENFEPKTVFHISSENMPYNEYVNNKKIKVKTEKEDEKWDEFFPNLMYLDNDNKLDEIDLTGSVLSENGKDKLFEIIRQYKNAFVRQGEIGNYKGPIEHSIHLIPGSVPTSQRPYRVPMALRDEVERQIKELLEKKIIRPSTSAFCAPIVLVRKKDNSYRMAIDYRRLNNITMPETYIMPLVQDILDLCGSKRMYTTFDFKMGFYQINMNPKDIEKTAFGTFLGLFEFIKLPFGLKGAPSTFMRAMNELRRELTSATFVYMDDVVLASNSEDDHLNDIAQFLRVVVKSGMKLHLGKCKWALKEIKYLGMLISEEGIRPDPKNIETVQKFNEPKTLTELRSFIGAVSYFRKFIKNFAGIMKPLYEATKKEQINWGKEHSMAFKTIIEKLTTAPVLKSPKWGKEFTLETDASSTALGACLLQKDSKGVIHPVSFWSRILNKHEKNYHSTELEALAVVEALKNYEAYIEGSGQTIVRTDNSAICQLLKKKEAKGRLAKFQMIIQNFDIKFEHRSGKSNAFCDHVSRYPPNIKEEEKIKLKICEISVMNFDKQTLRKETLNDPILSKILKMIKKEWNMPIEDEVKPYLNIKNEINEENGILELNDGRIIIPSSMREMALKILHRAHFGTNKTKLKARQLMFWPNINKDIDDLINSCENCKKYSDNPPKVPLKQWESAEKPWQRIHVDYAGPFLGISFFVMVDAYSKYPFIKIMKVTTSDATIDFLEEIFSQYGYPLTLVSDNGPQLISENFEKYLVRNGIIHKKSPPYHPQSNGLAERFVRTAKNSIKKMVGEETPTKKKLNEIIRIFLLEYRSTPHSSTGQTPSKLFLKREIRNGLEMILNMEQLTKEKIENEKEIQMQNANIKFGNKNVNKKFEIGELIWIKNHGENKWEKGIVLSLIGNAMLEALNEESGKNHRLHFDQVKPRRLSIRRRMAADEDGKEVEEEQ